MQQLRSTLSQLYFYSTVALVLLVRPATAYLSCVPPASTSPHTMPKSPISIPTASIFDGNITRNASFQHCALVPLIALTNKTTSSCQLDISPHYNTSLLTQHLDNTTCIAALLDYKVLSKESLDCRLGALSEHIHQAIHTISWQTYSLPTPNVFLAVRDEQHKSCLGSPYFGCHPWNFRSRVFRPFVPYPPHVDVFLAIQEDWVPFIHSTACTNQHNALYSAFSPQNFTKMTHEQFKALQMHMNQTDLPSYHVENIRINLVDGMAFLFVSYTWCVEVGIWNEFEASWMQLFLKILIPAVVRRFLLASSHLCVLFRMG